MKALTIWQPWASLVVDHDIFCLQARKNFQEASIHCSWPVREAVIDRAHRPLGALIGLQLVDPDRRYAPGVKALIEITDNQVFETCRADGLGHRRLLVTARKNSIGSRLDLEGWS